LRKGTGSVEGGSRWYWAGFGEKRSKGSSVNLSGNKGLQWTIILENFISFPKRKDEF
jgi:hypothetical protein